MASKTTAKKGKKSGQPIIATRTNPQTGAVEQAEVSGNEEAKAFRGGANIGNPNFMNENLPVKIETRPTGTPKSFNIDVTGLSAQEEAQVRAKQRADIFAAQIPTVEQLQKETNVPQPPEGVFPEGSLPNKIASALGNEAPQKTPAQVGKEIVQTAAKIYDSLSSILLSRDTLPVRQAQESFTTASKTIDLDIELVKQGIKSPADARKDFENAVISINRLEAQTKGLGLINLKYWLDDGKSLEAQIILEKQILANQRIKLQAASLGL